MAAARRSQLVVGEIVRPHGLHGAVVVRLDTDQLDRLAPGTTYETSRGELVVQSSRPLRGRFVVTFKGVGSTEQAERLRGTTLTAEPRDVDGALWVDELVGASVLGSDGRVLGTIVAVEANPASDLLVLDSGALIPSRFVVGALSDGVVTVEVPEGLV
jgi:16S rRNA processing protein RimM